MIALGQQDFGEQKERPAENLQAGREFSAVRRKPHPRPRRPGERAAKALVYVKGPTPLHLPLTSYSHFDGTAWHEEPCCDRHFPAEPEPRGTWLRLPWSEAPFLAGIVTHQVKIGTLESSPMPVPPHLSRFRVGSVNRLDFFGWAQFGIIRMTDRTIPAGTVIDSEARTVDPERLRLSPLLRRPGNEDDHHISFQGDYRIDPTVAALAKRWVADRPEGWCQVEAVIASLRQGFDHDRSATVPAGCTDVVAEFLLRSHRGPDYLFASAAAVLLRSLGYPTRVVSGLYAPPGQYDPRTHHTPVTRDDVHCWAEVRLWNGTWVAVEPTPGYELLPAVRPWSEQIAQALWAVGNWARGHVAVLLASVLSLVLIVIRRHHVLDRAATLGFALIGWRDPRRYVMRALTLIECRSRWAGRARPPGITPARWYYPLAHDAAGEARTALEELIRLAGWATHAPARSGLPAPAGTPDIPQTCRSAVRAWTLARFRQALTSRPGKAA
jgi:protein-glutamine gamma-glutamyltransferase